MAAKQWRRAAALVCGGLLVWGVTSVPSATATGGTPPCTAATTPPPPVTTTTLRTVEQAYYCVFAHFYGGDRLDNRTLLASAFAGFIAELSRRGTDHPDATMPALSGDRAADWAAFAAVYERVSGDLPADPALRQALAEATLTAMVSSLQDNHARWLHDELPPTGYAYGLGLVTSPAPIVAPQKALPPAYIRLAYGPAAEKGLRPGDIVKSVNGAPLFAGDVLSPGVLNLLYPRYSVDTDPVRLTLHRPATGRTWTVTLTPTLFKLGGNPRPDQPAPPDGVALVKIPNFMDGTADRTLADIARQAEGGSLDGVVLDLRGNTGGSPTEVDRLLGAFAHGKITGYQCDAVGACIPHRTDDSVSLLNLPLVVLTDGDCGSACEHFSSAVKDLNLGQLVGTRTAGLISGSATGYLLADNSTLLLPARHHLGPNHETIDGIGVAPDHYVPRTAQDLSTGRDPGLDKALALLDR